MIVRTILSRIAVDFINGRANNKGIIVGPINDGNAFVKYQCQGCSP